MQKRRDLPPLDLLRGFEAAARHLSFTRAAEELFLTQSAVSRQVQGLEEALGVPLFQRKHRALLLTDAGRAQVQDCYTGGIDAHSAWGWVVRDNVFEGFWCDQGLSEHAVHFWVTGRDRYSQ